MLPYEEGRTYTKEEVMTNLATDHGLFGPDAEKHVRDTVAAIPAATRGQYPDDIWAAFVAYSSVTAQNSPMNPPANPSAVETTTPAEEKKGRKNANAVRLSASEVQASRATVDKSMKERVDIMNQTTVLNLCIDRPSPIDYIPEGTTIIPKCTPEKLKEYEAALVPGEQNKQAFETLKAAVENGTPMPARIGTNAYKVIGVQIEHPADEPNQPSVTEYMSTDKLMGYLVTKVPGFIQAQKPNGITIRIRWNQSDAKNSSGEYAEGSPSILYVGKKDIIASGQTVCTSKVKTSAQEPEGVKIESNLRTEMSFKIYTKASNERSRGERTVRLSGRASIFDLERSTDEFQNIFGNIGRAAQMTLPTGAELEKLTSGVANTIAWMAQKNNSSRYGVEDFMSQIKDATGSTETKPDEDIDLD